MSYQSKMNGMVSSHFADYQDELFLGRKLHDLLYTARSSMPYGYPSSVYHPKTIYKKPKFTRFVFKPGGILSNGVPKVLSGELIDGYLLGIYNPRIQ